MARKRRNSLFVLTEQVDDLPEGLMAIIDDVDEIDEIVEFELNNRFRAVPMSKTRTATIKEKYHYDFWKKHGRQEQLMNVNSIVD